MTHPSKPFTPSWNDLTEPRVGIMLHYDASTTDQGAIDWFTHPDCTVSYNFIVMDSGNIIGIAPPDARAWHAGFCKTDNPRQLVYRDANSAFYGIAIAATTGDVATREAKRSVAALCLTLFRKHGWPLPDAGWRIVSHRSQAVYPRRLPDGTPHPKAGKRGRKYDPEGPDLAHPVMNTNEIRGLVLARQILAA